MKMLRKAGVWLGVVEEEDERDDRDGHGPFLDDDIDDFMPTPPRSLAGRAARAPERSRDRYNDSYDDSYDASHDTSYERHERVLPPPPPPPPPPVPPPPPPPPRAESARVRAAEPAPPRPREREVEEEYDEPDEPPAPRSRPATRREPASRDSTARESASRSSRSDQQVTPFPTRDSLALAPPVQIREKAVVGDEKRQPYQITTLAPTSYSQARDIGEHFRDGNPVIMNLTEMAEADAKRLVDFAAGLAFGLRGSMERVTNRVFLLSPANIQVSAEDKQRIADGGYLDER